MNVGFLNMPWKPGNLSFQCERAAFSVCHWRKNGITFVENEQSVLDILTGAFGHVQASEAPASSQAPTRI